MPTVDDQSARTILVVEDTQGVRQLIASTLARHGYRVLEAANGLDALSVFDQEAGRIDLVLTDMRMPKAGGHRLISHLRSLRPDLKIIAMSGDPHDTVAPHGVPFLAKPFLPSALLELVRALLDGDG
jgi:two-component system cell cycle sensor histidine kinase/response regulator CckA